MILALALIACQECHPNQVASHAASAHARSLAPATDARWGALQATWAFGAGKQAVTFVSPAGDGYYLEHGLSHYTALDRFDLTPGHSTTAGERYRVFDPSAAILRCFQCHSTGKLRVDSAGTIIPAKAGIFCEACHGPSEDHVKRRGPIANPAKLTAAAMNDACGSCHRKPTPTGGDTNFSDPWNVRHQPLYLARSACFLKSGGRLKCTTCHDAHSGEARSACASCHPQPKHVKPVSGSCESCHMPKVEPRAGLAFANHWIKR